jgi:hypothetical protein
MQALRDILPAHPRTYRNTSDRDTVIDLPEAVDALIDDKAYRPKFRKLIREGYLAELLQLAELAPRLATEQPPSHWFARYTSKARWSQTLDWLAGLVKVARLTREVAKRLALTPVQLRPVYAAVWRLGDGVIRHAVTAAEVGRDKLKLFCWLTRPNSA